MRRDDPPDHELEVEDDFDAPTLDTDLWFPHHLPQWSSRDQAAARYELADGCLHLLVAADQQPWCPEFDGHTRVSSLQTGVFAGPVGSTIGQHRFNPAAVVREAQETRRLHSPQYGAFAMRARAEIDAHSMVALWMIGFEDDPTRSAEICICEVFGSELGPGATTIGMGVHPFGDPTITDDFAKVTLPIDVTEFHEYGAVWTPDAVTFHVDGEPVRHLDQSPAYPMQLMLGIYDFGPPAEDDRPTRRLVVDWFRAHRRR